MNVDNENGLTPLTSQKHDVLCAIKMLLVHARRFGPRLVRTRDGKTVHQLFEDPLGSRSIFDGGMTRPSSDRKRQSRCLTWS